MSSELTFAELWTRTNPLVVASVIVGSWTIGWYGMRLLFWLITRIAERIESLFRALPNE